MSALARPPARVSFGTTVYLNRDTARDGKLVVKLHNTLHRNTLPFRQSVAPKMPCLGSSGGVQLVVVAGEML